MAATILKFENKKSLENKATEAPEISSEAKDETIRVLTKNVRYHNSRAVLLEKEKKEITTALSQSTRVAEQLAESTHLLQIMLHNQQMDSSKQEISFYKRALLSIKSLFIKN
ncbi:MAG: hypothetical protein QM500_21315 [Methylococcales bacterium]